MTKQSLKCSKCSRTFSMPAHLGRHMIAIHGTPIGTRAVKKRTMASKAAGKRGKRVGKASARRKIARTTLVQSPVGVVSRLVGDMQSYLGELSTQRVALDAEVAAITGALKAMGSAAPAAGMGSAPRRGRPPGRGARPGSLKSFIVRVLSQRVKPMSPSDIARAVAKSGYKSKARDLTKAVSNSIPELKSVRKVGFGLYKI